MLDKYLHHWRTYQLLKKKIKVEKMAANGFACSVVIRNVDIPATVEIIENEDAKYIRITHEEGFERNIPLTSVRGFDKRPDLGNIILTFEDQRPAILHFTSMLQLKTAFEALRVFLRDQVPLPSPPASSPSSGSDN